MPTSCSSSSPARSSPPPNPFPLVKSPGPTDTLLRPALPDASYGLPYYIQSPLLEAGKGEYTYQVTLTALRMEL